MNGNIGDAMNDEKMIQGEQAYLSSYHIGAFERPSLAVDIGIFSILEEANNQNVRKLPIRAFKLLLIKRGSYPYKGYWALPGGFCKSTEDVQEAAQRELYEETNVKDAYLKLVGAYGALGRDPRGWIISNTFFALINGEQCTLRAGTDAWQAEWFTVNLSKKEIKRELSEDNLQIQTVFDLELSSEGLGECLKATIMEYKRFKNYHEYVTYEVIEKDRLAFDHAEVILRTLLELRKEAKQNAQLIFDLMPEKFTLTQLQKAFSLVLDQTLLTPNFRRKIADYVLETNESIEGVGYRPAKLFKRNMNQFYR